MTESDHFLWWRGSRGDRPRDDRWTEIGEEAFQEKERRITGRHHLPGPVPDWAEDMFRSPGLRSSRTSTYAGPASRTGELAASASLCPSRNTSGGQA